MMRLPRPHAFGVLGFAFAHGGLRDFHMPSRRIDRILTGTALALVLGLTAAANPALAQDQKSIEALVPMPEPANLPPPSAADVGTTETTGSTAILLPDPPDLPPPTFKDVAAPTTPPAAEAAPAAVAT